MSKSRFTESLMFEEIDEDSVIDVDSTSYAAGWKAYENGEEFDEDENASWQAGWLQAEEADDSL